MQSKRKIVFPLVIVFVLLNTFFLSSGKLLTKWGLDKDILLIANCLFFFLALGTFFLQKRALYNSNPNVFVRSVMASVMIKMLACAIAVIAYALLMRSTFSKATLFVGLFLYLVYMVVDVRLILKLNKQKDA